MKNYIVTIRKENIQIKKHTWVKNTITHEIFCIKNIESDMVSGSLFEDWINITELEAISVGLKTVNKYGEMPEELNLKWFSKLITSKANYNRWKKEQDHCEEIFIPFNKGMYKEMSSKIGTVIDGDSPHLLSSLKYMLL